MRVLGIAGLSVTMPHKHDVAAAVDRLDPAAAALRSVNTVSWDGGDLVGSSTDGAGFVAALAEDGVDVDGLRVAVIGAGGAARSVIDALGRAGADSIRVVNRTIASAESASELARVAAVGTVDDIGLADLVVNAVERRHGNRSIDCHRRRSAVRRRAAAGHSGRRRPRVPPASTPPGCRPPNRWVPARSTGSAC